MNGFGDIELTPVALSILMSHFNIEVAKCLICASVFLITYPQGIFVELYMFLRYVVRFRTES